jgi:hypothetical protein
VRLPEAEAEHCHRVAEERVALHQAVGAEAHLTAEGVRSLPEKIRTNRDKLVSSGTRRYMPIADDAAFGEIEEREEQTYHAIVLRVLHLRLVQLHLLVLNPGHCLAMLTTHNLEEIVSIPLSTCYLAFVRPTERVMSDRPDTATYTRT